MTQLFYTIVEASAKLELTHDELLALAKHYKSHGTENSTFVGVDHDRVHAATVDELVARTTHVPRTLSFYKLVMLVGSNQPSNYCDEYHASVMLLVKPSVLREFGKAGLLQVRLFKSELGLSRLYLLDNITNLVQQLPVNKVHTHQTIKSLLINWTMDASISTVNINGLPIDVIKLPDGSYRIPVEELMFLVGEVMWHDKAVEYLSTALATQLPDDPSFTTVTVSGISYDTVNPSQFTALLLLTHLLAVNTRATKGCLHSLVTTSLTTILAAGFEHTPTHGAID
jgi:hypothetical protein